MKQFANVLLCLVLPVFLAAQTVVNVPSDAGAGGNLNNAVADVVNADPTGAQLSNTIFKLEPYGYYILTGPIVTPNNSHLTIIADPPGNTQETSPPMILWTTAGGVTTTYNFQCYGDLTMKNIWILCANALGAQVGSSILISDDTLSTSGNRRYLEMDGCIIDYMGIGNGGGAIEPASRHFSAKITNTYFRNLTDPHFKYYGRPMSWVYNSTDWHNDTIIFENCTISNVGYAYMQEAGEYTTYLSFNHCTFYNTVEFTLESSYWHWLSVTNCLFVNAFMEGATTTPSRVTTPNGGAINIDSVATFTTFTFPFSDSKDVDPFLQRHILFANCSYGNEQWYINLLNNNPYNPAVDSQKIHRMPMMSGKTLRFFTGMTDGQKNFPYMNLVNIMPAVDTTAELPAVYRAETDPQFLLPPANVDSIIGFLYGRWYSAANVNWAYDPESDTKQVWPMNENLSYMNATLKTAAMGGYPLGDLFHWYPTEYATWNAQKDAEHATITNMLTNGVTGVRSIPTGSVPAEYALSQNYPNPFNPLTHIQYSVPKSGFVTLKVYTMLGEEVATVYSGHQAAGMYSAEFDGSALPSGVYFYRLESDNVSLTKKLMLLK